MVVSELRMACGKPFKCPFGVQWKILLISEVCVQGIEDLAVSCESVDKMV